MIDRSYAIAGAGFMLKGTIDEARLHLMVRLLDKAAGELQKATLEDRAAKWENGHDEASDREPHVPRHV